MSGGDGIDIGAIYQLLREVADIVVDQGRKLDRLDARMEAVERRLDDPAEGLAALRRAMNDQATSLIGLRRTVTEYHSSVLGHGILISELDERVSRIEQHLNLPPVA